jgi:hypothetical protein
MSIMMATYGAACELWHLWLHTYMVPQLFASLIERRAPTLAHCNTKVDVALFGKSAHCVLERIMRMLEGCTAINSCYQLHKPAATTG